MENELDMELEEEISSENSTSVDNKTLQTEVARKKHWREKYEKTSSELQQLKSELESYKAKIQEGKPQASETPASQVDEIETVLSLRSDGYFDSEILKLRSYAKKMNVPISEVINDPFIKSGLEAERQKAKVGEATPSPSSSSFTVQGKTWAQMTNEERKANFDSFVKGGGKNSNI